MTTSSAAPPRHGRHIPMLQSVSAGRKATVKLVTKLCFEPNYLKEWLKLAHEAARSARAVESALIVTVSSFCSSRLACYR